ncbi:hypothetical protein, partial [Methanoregula sp.]|uniref:hypothetical protein n=1 Tax=Methanoregula sp. TaxID=2052170 RepID=UPI000CB5BA67
YFYCFFTAVLGVINYNLAYYDKSFVVYTLYTDKDVASRITVECIAAGRGATQSQNPAVL